MDSLADIDIKLPHGSNLWTKIRSSPEDPVLSNIVSRYRKFLQEMHQISADTNEVWIRNALVVCERYYAFLRKAENKKFSHQSDFLSSLVPELLYLAYSKIIQVDHKNLEVTTQKDIIIDLSFLPYNGSHITFKPKRVDVAILKKIDLVIGGDSLEFSIPVVAAEVKTNLDKNMISGVEYSVERLKRTFPLCKFYLISEFADFSYKKQNYAGTAIDEILILRKQKRSEVRRAPNNINTFDAALFASHIIDVMRFLNENTVVPTTIQERLSSGQLIKRS